MAFHTEALDFFRKTVSFLFREVGAVEKRNHPTLYKKVMLKNGFFSHQRKVIAKNLYFKTITEVKTNDIVKPYEEITGLSLRDIHEVFAEGDWKNSSGSYSYGGPKWAKIAESTMALKRAIDSDNFEEQERLLEKMKELKHNNGLLIDKFQELTR